MRSRRTTEDYPRKRSFAYKCPAMHYLEFHQYQIEIYSTDEAEWKGALTYSGTVGTFEQKLTDLQCSTHTGPGVLDCQEHTKACLGA